MEGVYWMSHTQHFIATLRAVGMSAENICDFIIIITLFMIYYYYHYHYYYFIIIIIIIIAIIIISQYLIVLSFVFPGLMLSN